MIYWQPLIENMKNIDLPITCLGLALTTQGCEQIGDTGPEAQTPDWDSLNAAECVKQYEGLGFVNTLVDYALKTAGDPVLYAQDYADDGSIERADLLLQMQGFDIENTPVNNDGCEEILDNTTIPVFDGDSVWDVEAAICDEGIAYVIFSFEYPRNAASYQIDLAALWHCNAELQIDGNSTTSVMVYPDGSAEVAE